MDRVLTSTRVRQRCDWTVFRPAGRVETSAAPGPLPSSLMTCGSRGLYQSDYWEQDHVPQHQDIVQFRSAGDR